MPSAMTLSSSTIRTLAILDLNHGGCEGLSGASSRFHRCCLARAPPPGPVACDPRDGRRSGNRSRRASFPGARGPQMAELVNDLLLLAELESARGRGARDDRVPTASRRSAPGSRTAPSGPRSRFESRRSPRSSCRCDAEVQTIAENLAQNAIRYAGPAATVTLALKPACCGSAMTVEGSRKRSSLVSSSASIEAIALAPLAGPPRARDRQARRALRRWPGRGIGRPGRGLHIECRFPAP